MNTDCVLSRRKSEPALDQTTGLYGTIIRESKSIKANIQPAVSEDLQKLEEGLRTKNVKLIITSEPLQVLDRIVKDGKTFEIMHLDDFSLQGVQIFAHYQGIAVEVKE